MSNDLIPRHSSRCTINDEFSDAVDDLPPLDSDDGYSLSCGVNETLFWTSIFQSRSYFCPNIAKHGGCFPSFIRIFSVVLPLTWTSSAGAALYSKAFLQNAGAPMLLTMGQSALGAVCTFLFISKGGRTKIPSLTGSRTAILVVIASHFVGTALTNVSTLFSSASFVNTIKAADPLFAVVLARAVLGQRFTTLTHISLVIIVVGIILACTTEFKFEFNGFWTVMTSNACFPLRAIYTKKLLNESPVPLSGQTIFFWLSLTTFLVSAPFVLFEYIDRPEVYAAALDQSGPGFRALCLAVLMHYGYNFLSFILVAEVQPLTYSIGNSVKRLVTIYGSILYFRNPVSLFNLSSSAVAVAGVFLYSWEEERMRKRKAAAAKHSLVDKV